MHKLTHVGVFSVAKIFGAIGFVLGLAWGLFNAISLIIWAGSFGNRVASDHGGMTGPIGSFGLAILLIVGAPLISGIAHFLVGMLYAVIINIALYLGGGLEVRLESSVR